MDRPSRLLRDRWYKKLKEEGFREIEDVNSNKEFLIDWHSQFFQFKYTPQEFLEKQRYFQMTRDFLYMHKFKSKRDKQIWFLHSEGLSCMEIANKISLSKPRVHQIVFQLIRLMRGE